MAMTTQNLAVFLQNAVAKDRGVSPIADCASCVATPLGGYFGADVKAPPHAADPEPGMMESIPWPWILGTLAVSVPLTGFLTYKLTQSMAKSELGLKLFEKKVAAKRKKRKGKRKRKSRRR